jgi:hypothetical protein
VLAGPVHESFSGWDSGAAPVRASGWPAYRPVTPGCSRKKSSKAPLDLIAMEKSHRFQGFVQGNIILKKCNTNLENIQENPN